MTEHQPGTLLDNKYEVVRRLGSGGMGDIYLVHHQHLHQNRVVKILRHEHASNEAAQKRFLREARLATAIKHPNVAILYDYSKLPDGSFFMVWEYIEGEDVGEWLERFGPFPLPAALQLAIQALRGLEAIHSVGVIHRDISPDNLMITRDAKGRYQMKIIDLGLAKSLSADPKFEITQAGMFMGKLQYCSPEQVGLIKGQSLDRRTDIYSFAMVLYEMITGMQPFNSDEPQGFIFKRLSEDPLAMAGRNPAVQIPPKLDEIVRQALERDREKRIPDAIHFIEAIEPMEQRLRQTATQMMPRGTPLGDLVPGGAPRKPHSTGSITRSERENLLAEIDRAAARVRETSKQVDLAERALKAGQLDEVRSLIDQLEVTNPKAPGLATLKRRLEKVGGPKAAPAAGQPRAEQAAAGTPAAGQPTVDQAAAQVRETSKLTSLAESAMKAGNLDEARALIAKLESAAPNAPALGYLRQRLEQVSSRPAAPARKAPAPAAAPPAAAAPAAPALPEAESAPAAAAAGGGDSGELRTREHVAPDEDRSTREVEEKAKLQELAAEVPLREQGPAERIKEAEQMLERYLQKGQQNLATLALSTLLELAPEHPRRQEYEDWVRIVGEEAEQRERAWKAVEAGRAAIEKGDFKAGRKQLEIAARNDPHGSIADGFMAELEQAEADSSETARFEVEKGRFEKALEAGSLDEAGKALDTLGEAGFPRVALTLQQNRLEEARCEQRFSERMEAKDWKGAREVAHELSEALPQSQRPAAMFAMTDRRQRDAQRQESIVQGSQQLEIFLEEGNLDQASLALKILKQMDPENPQWGRYEQKIVALREV